MRKGIFQNVVVNVVLCALLFVPAGTWAWPQAWIFLALFNGCSQLLGIWLLKHDPALLAARMKSPFSANQRSRDRLVMVAIMVFFAAWVAFMAWDARRVGWALTPRWAEAIGAA